MSLSWFHRLLKSRSRPAARRHPARVRPGLEALETRDLLSVTSALVNGQLVVSGDNSGNTIAVNHSPGFTFVNGQSFLDSAIPNGLLIRPGAFDTVNLFATGLPTTIDGQGQAQGHLGVQAGFGNLAGVQGGLSIINAPDLAFVNLDDSLDNTPRNVTLSPINSVEGQITALGLPDIVYSKFTGALLFSGGHGRNVFTVQDTFAGLTTTLNTGTANNRVEVLGTSGPLVINGQGGGDRVDLGLTTPLQAVKADVTVTNKGNGFTFLDVNDASDNQSRNVSMGVDAGGFGFIKGLDPNATIRYLSQSSGGLVVNAPQIKAQTNNTFNITDTANNSAAPNTLIFGGNSGDTFNVLGTHGRLTIDAGFGKETINVGSAANTLDTIQGQVTVNGRAGGIDTLNINDQGSTTKHSYLQTANTLFRNGAAPITFSVIAHLNVNKGPVLGSPPRAKGLKVMQSARGSRLVLLTGRLTDAHAAAKLMLTVDWGDGSTPQSFKPGQSPFRLKHRYAMKGDYTVRAVWTDVKTGQSNSQDLSLQVT
jgi:hypothetical protein